jgi:Tol biopolymer transport system component/DNA-binding winged helix-turn-helix (wHTH) protein
MNPPAPQVSILRFRAFELDIATGELRKGGILVKLQPQPFRVLSLLAQRAGQIVGREEIQHELWDGETFVDFDRSINFCVSQIRIALSDDPEKPRYVETLPRRGYRFIAPVEALPGASTALPPPANSAPIIEREADVTKVLTLPLVVPRRKWGKRLQILAGVAGLFLAWFAYYWLTPIPPPRALRTVKITSSGNVDYSGRVVSDGSRIYFLQRRGGLWPVAETSMNGGLSEPVRFPFRENAKILDISPDRSEFLVGTFVRRGDEMPLWAVPAVGGSPRRIGEITSASAAWFPDGQKILYSKPDGIYQINQDGTNERRFAITASTPSHFSWSPDGRLLRFTLGDDKTWTAYLWEVSSDGSNLHRLLSGWNVSAQVCCGSWSRDGKYYIFSAALGGHWTIWAIREWGSLFHRTHRQPVQLTFGPNGFAEPVAEGNRVFFVVLEDLSENLVRYDFKTKQFVAHLQGILFAIDPLVAWHKEWVAYSASAGGESQGEIWRSRPDGTGRQQLTSLPFGARRPRWSPDGKLLTFNGFTSPNQLKSYVMPSDGGTPQELLPTGRASADPDWSPDGKSLTFAVGPGYTGWAESEAGIYQIDLHTRQYAKVPGSDNLIYPRWSPAGRYLAAVADDGSKMTLMLYDFESRHWSQLVQGVFLQNPTWSSDGQSIYYQDAFEPSQPIYRIWIAGHRRERIADFEELYNSGVVRSLFAGLAPDGSLLAEINRNYGDIFALDLDLP